MSNLAAELKALAEKHIGPLKDQVKEKKKALKVIVKQHEKEIAKIEAEIHKAQSMIAVATGKPVSPPTAEGNSAEKQTAPPAVVLEAMQEIVKQKQSCTVDALQKAVKDKMSSQKYVLTGLKQRVTKQLANAAFQVNGNKVSLAGAK